MALLINEGAENVVDRITGNTWGGLWIWLAILWAFEVGFYNWSSFVRFISAVFSG